MVRLLRLAILAGVVLSATVLMSLPREPRATTSANPAGVVRAVTTGAAQVAQGTGAALQEAGRRLAGSGAVAPGRAPACPERADASRGAPVETGPVVPAGPAGPAAPSSAGPPAPSDRPSDASRGAPRLHVVEKGETLGKIARRYYGNADAWRRILDANPSVDPKRIRPGQALVVPVSAPAPR